MEDLRSQKVALVFDCTYFANSSVFGEVTPELLREHMMAYFEGIFVDIPLDDSRGDFYKVTSPEIIMTQKELESVYIIPDADKLPTDDESILADFEAEGVPVIYLELEKRTRQLENQGLTRSDAQGVASAEGFDPDRERYIALAKTEGHKPNPDSHS